MNALSLAVFACLAVYSSAGLIGGHGGGAIIEGPSGIVTPHGAIGPVDHGYGGHGGFGYGGYGGHGPAAVIAGPVAGHSYIAGPTAFGGGYGGHGLGYAGYGGFGGHAGYGGHGVAVHGPETVPAVISGPSGKIVAHGLYGVPHHGGHYW